MIIRPNQIPDEVVEAALKKRGLMREAIADALNAWPGVEHQTPNDWSNKPHLILPLPTEASDD